MESGDLEPEATLRRRNDQLALLARVSHLLICGGGAERDLLTDVFGEVARSIGAEMYFNYQPKDDVSMRLCHWGGLTDDERTLFETMRYGELLCGRVAVSRRPIVVEDIAHTDAEGSEAVRAAGYGAYAGFPLLADGRLLGTIAFITRTKTHFAEGELQTVQTVCDQVAASLERARLTEELRASEARLRQMLAIDAVGVMFWDLSTERLVDANDTFLRMMGYSRADLQGEGLTWRKLTPPEYHAISEAELSRFRAIGRVGPYEKEFLRKDGTRQWLLFSGSSLGTSECVELCVDISDRKLAEAALRESEERLRLLGDNVPDSAIYQYVLDPAGRAQFTHVSAGIARLTGLRAEDVLRDAGTLQRQLLPEEGARLLEAGYRSQRELTDLDIEVTMRRLDGQLRCMRIHSRPRRRPDGCTTWDGVQTDVTDRRRSEEALRAAGESFRQLVERSPFGVYAVDSDFRLAMVSAGARKVFENVRPLLGRDFEEVLHILWPEPFVSEALGHFRRTLETGDAYHAPSTVEERADSGETEAYDWKLERMILPDGRPGVVCYFYDLSERQRYEEALRVARSRLETAIDASQVVLFQQDRALRYTWIHNPALGYQASEVLGKRDRDLFRRPEDATRTEALKRYVIATGVMRREEVCVVDDEPRYFDLVVQPDRDAAGEIQGVICAAIDVTSLKQTEADLAKAAERAEIAQEAARATLYELHPRTGEVFRSDSIAVVTGYAREELPPTAEAWRGLIHPEDRARAWEGIERGIESGHGYTLEYRIVPKTGESVWVHDQARVFPDAAGRPGRVVGMVQDITARKRIEEQLREADQKKNEFLATLAHELRNPLAPIRTALELMNRPQTDAESFEKYRSVMDRQVEQMTRLIDDLMDVARIARGQIHLQKTRMRLADAVEAAVEISRPLMDARQHDLVVELPSEPIDVEGDLTRVSQVLANLLNNAAKYTDPGGRVRLSVERRGGDVLARVEDNGVGIPASMLIRVFDMFAQVDQTLDPAQGGLGIGLSLAQRLVEMHGGSLTASSAGPGQGSTFTVRLPLPADAPSATAEAPTGSIPPSGRRVLVVDDNEDAAELLTELLRRRGHDARSAHDGHAALELGRAFAPELVFCDLGMPGMDGVEVARRLRSEPATRGATLVALTGWGGEAARRRTADAGFDRHLIKPVEFAALEEILASSAPRGL